MNVNVVSSDDWGICAKYVGFGRIGPGSMGTGWWKSLWIHHAGVSLGWLGFGSHGRVYATWADLDRPWFGVPPDEFGPGAVGWGAGAIDSYSFLTLRRDWPAIRKTWTTMRPDAQSWRASRIFAQLYWPRTFVPPAPPSHVPTDPFAATSPQLDSAAQRLYAIMMAVPVLAVFGFIVSVFLLTVRSAGYFSYVTNTTVALFLAIEAMFLLSVICELLMRRAQPWKSLRPSRVFPLTLWYNAAGSVLAPIVATAIYLILWARWQ